MNQTAKCSGAAIIITRDVRSANALSHLPTIPPHYLQDGWLHLSISRGTLIPTANLRGGGMVNRAHAANVVMNSSLVSLPPPATMPAQPPQIPPQPSVAVAMHQTPASSTMGAAIVQQGTAEGASVPQVGKSGAAPTIATSVAPSVSTQQPCCATAVSSSNVVVQASAVNVVTAAKDGNDDAASTELPTAKRSKTEHDAFAASDAGSTEASESNYSEMPLSAVVHDGPGTHDGPARDASLQTSSGDDLASALRLASAHTQLIVQIQSMLDAGTGGDDPAIAAYYDALRKGVGPLAEASHALNTPDVAAVNGVAQYGSGENGSADANKGTAVNGAPNETENAIEARMRR